MRGQRLIITALLAISPLSVNADPILDTDGQLIGATDVGVNGLLYDVSFVDGSCIELFNGCDNLSDFVFQTELVARDAAQALFDQVLLGMFDTMPELTGAIGACGDPCNIFTPYAPFFEDGGDLFVPVISARNVDDSLDEDEIRRSDRRRVDRSTLGNGTRLFAVWSGPPQPVPEPGTFALLGIGLVGMALARRRRKA